MHPLIPKSVKMTAQTYDRIHETAVTVGYSDNQLIAEAITAMLNLIDQPELDYVPKLIILARTAKAYDKSPHPWAHAKTPVDMKKKKKSEPVLQK